MVFATHHCLVMRRVPIAFVTLTTTVLMAGLTSLSYADNALYLDGQAYHDAGRFAPPQSFVFDAPPDCSVQTLKHYAYERLRNDYLFADLVPEVDPDDFATPNELVEALAVDPFTEFTRSTDGGAGRFGTGLFVRRNSDGEYRIAYVAPGSPAAMAGFQRSWEVVLVNGERVEDVLAKNDGRLPGGDRDNPQTLILDVVLPDGRSGFGAVSESSYLQTTQFSASTFARGDGVPPVGLISFDFFPAGDRFSGFFAAAAQAFNERGIGVLILDFRNNVGGTVRTAYQLLDRLAGNALNHMPKDFVRYGGSRTAENYTTRFEATPDAGFNPWEIIVLTSGQTASAAELVINGLRPYFDVVTIGESTFGKNLQASEIYNRECGFFFNLIDRESLNVQGQSVAGGIAPTCRVEDDYRFPTNAASEPLIAAALNYVETGQCPVE